MGSDIKEERRDATTSSEGSSRASRVIFGSCSSQHYEQPFWKVIRERNPAAFVWTGDAVYADDRLIQTNSHGEKGWSLLPRFRPQSLKYTHATPEYLRELYEKQLRVPGYQDLIRQENESGERISIFGAIDDHDYGINNGDKTFPFRTESGMEFINFLGLKDETSAMSRRASTGLGVYGVQVYDFSMKSGRLLSDSEAGLDPDVVSDSSYRERMQSTSSASSDKLVAIFVLDVRSNRTPWAKSIPERYRLDPEGDFLGENQWEWFEKALGRSTAKVNIIVSGIQVHAPSFYDVNVVENWSGFPKAQHRLYQTILKSHVRAPILLSGDIHMSQLLRKDCQRMEPIGNGVHRKVIRPIYEVTSSGMTHSFASKASYCGRPNKSKLCTFYPFNVLVELVVTYAYSVNPWTAILKGRDDDRLIDDGPRRNKNKHLQYSLERNIAEVEVDWTEDLVILRILGDEGQTLLRQDWSMDRLTGDGRFRSTGVNTLLSDKSFEVGQERLEASLNTPFPRDHDDYICVNYRGNIDRVHFAFGVVSTIGVFVITGLYPVLFCFGLLSRFVLRRFRRRTSNHQRPRHKGEKVRSNVRDRTKQE